MIADLHLSTGAAALDALPPDEAAEFASHVAECPTCAAELAGFAETVAKLGAVALEIPPPSLRAAVMERIKTTAQLPPIVSARDAEPDQSTRAAAKVIQLRPWYRRPQAYLAAAAAAIVIAGGTTLIVHDSSSNGGGSTVAACLSAAPDSTAVSPALGGGVVGLAQSCKSAMVTLTGLKALPADKVYQLWVMQNLDPASARSAGLLDVRNGSAVHTAALQPNDTNIAVTVEPAGGSKEPTTRPIWLATFKA